MGATLEGHPGIATGKQRAEWKFQRLQDAVKTLEIGHDQNEET